MSTLKLYQIEKSAEDIRKTVLKNIVKMVTNRGLLDPKMLETNIENLVKIYSDDLTYTIKLDKKMDDKAVIMAVKYAPHKITAVNKSYGITDFLQNYKENPKIVVVKSISKKAHQQFLKNFDNVEIFMEEDLMIDLVDYVMIPKHELLTEDENLVFYEKFNCKKRNMPRLLSTDPVARYYAMKPGDICRIIRPSEKSGFTTTYRLVIKGTLK